MRHQYWIFPEEKALVVKIACNVTLRQTSNVIEDLFQFSALGRQKHTQECIPIPYRKLQYQHIYSNHHLHTQRLKMRHITPK